jgi:zinc-ribbon domain
VKCPKCNTEVRDVARFCPRCHATLRYACPSCNHEQRHGGTCDKCGVDFLKYITAVVATKKDEADVIHERIEQRSNLLRNILLTPFNMGIPLLRQLFQASKRGAS